MLDAPCSRVGHIYRKFAPFPNPGHGDFVGRNYRRVAEVWMDEYAQFLYKRRPHYLNIDTGDISEQKALRQKLNCKSFRWFMTQVAFDLTAKYPTVEPEPFGEGNIKPLLNTNLCVDAHHGQQMDKLLLTHCEDSSNAEQKFVLSWHKDIRSKERNMCWDLPDSSSRSPIRLFSCHLGGGNQLWRYLPETKQIKHGNNDKCVQYDLANREVYIEQCSAQEEGQKWVLAVNEARMRQWDSQRLRVTGPIEDYA